MKCRLTCILTLSLLAAHITSTRACEIMGFSFNVPVSGQTWFADFRLRGHLHVDGWGLAHYPDKSAQLFKEGIPAHQSALAKFSMDEGRSWDAPVRLMHSLATDCGYPSSVQRADGRIVTAFYSQAVLNHNRYHMGVAIWHAPVPAR